MPLQQHKSRATDMVQFSADMDIKRWAQDERMQLTCNPDHYKVS